MDHGVCLTTAVGMTSGNFLQTCIETSLLQTKIIEIVGQLSHTVPHHACIKFVSFQHRTFQCLARD